MDVQDRDPLWQRGQGDRDLSIEAAGTEQRGVEDLRPVGGGDHDDPLCRIEAVHLGQQLVQSLLTLVVRHDGRRSAPPLTDRVDLVDEDDRRCALPSLLEEVTDPRRSDADEQLHEARAGHREERCGCLSRNRPGQEGLTGARRPDHQDAPRCHRANPRIPIGVLQEVDDLADLVLGALIPRHIGEGRLRPLRIEYLRLRFADAEHSLHASAGTFGQTPPQVAQHDEREQQDHHRQHLGAEGGTGCLRRDLNAGLLQIVEERLPGLRRDCRRVGRTLGKGAGRGACGGDRDRLHLVGRDVVQELRVVERDRLRAPNRRQGEKEDNEDRQGHEPEVVSPRRRLGRRGRGAIVVRRRRSGLFGHGLTLRVSGLSAHIGCPIRHAFV